MEHEFDGLGFNPEQEKLDESDKDWHFGAVTVVGLADRVKGVVIALYAWSFPKNGVYPRVEHRINHVVIFWQKKFQTVFPKGEIQKGVQDFMDCVARGFNNEIEKQMNYCIANKLFSTEFTEWLVGKGYYHPENGVELSDRFPAMNSNTTRSGNSMKAPIEAIRTMGSIPKHMLPKEEGMTWAQYHDKSKITQEMVDLGKEFTEWMKVNYVYVPRADFGLFSGGTKWDIFDNYIEKVGDFIKRLAIDYKMWYRGYQVLINELPQEQKPGEKGEDEMLKLYKRRGNPRIYQKGLGDGLYHHIINEPVFQGLYGDFNSNNFEIVDLDDILESEIGFTIYNKESLIMIILNLFKGLKGKTNMGIQKRMTKAVPKLGSSVNPEKVAATVKGAILASATIIIAFGGYFGVTINLADLNTIAGSLQNGITAAGVVYGCLLTLFGAVRKIANRKP